MGEQLHCHPTISLVFTFPCLQCRRGPQCLKLVNERMLTQLTSPKITTRGRLSKAGPITASAMSSTKPIRSLFTTTTSSSSVPTRATPRCKLTAPTKNTTVRPAHRNTHCRRRDRLRRHHPPRRGVQSLGQTRLASPPEQRQQRLQRLARRGRGGHQARVLRLGRQRHQGWSIACKSSDCPISPSTRTTLCHPTDAYAEAKAFPRWFPGVKIVCLCIHEAETKQNVLNKHEENWHDVGVKQLWDWVHPVATARACLLSVTSDTEKWERDCEVFNIIAPDTTLKNTSSGNLANKFYPETELREDWRPNRAFWTTEKAERMLGWTHHEKE